MNLQFYISNVKIFSLFFLKFGVDFKEGEQRRTKVRRSSYSLKDAPKLRQKDYSHSIVAGGLEEIS